MYGGETVKLKVHGVEHDDDLNRFTLRANGGEGHHITEEDGALLKLTWRTETTDINSHVFIASTIFSYGMYFSLFC